MTGYLVAVKKFKSTDDDPIFLKSSVREVKLLRSLKHPNIVELRDVYKRFVMNVTILSFDIRNGKLFLVFEFMDKNLLEVLHEYHPSGFEQSRLRSTVYQIIRGIEYCHRVRVIHRDIKPENILMNLADMSVKICDFGLARLMPSDGKSRLTDYVATRWYRAPELVVGSPNYGPGIDVFAAGCIMAELADGEPLLPGDSEISQLGIIAKVLGPIPHGLMGTFNSNQPTLSAISDDPAHHQDIEERFLTRLSLKAVRILRQLVQVDPEKRVSAKMALLDPYFENDLTDYGRMDRNLFSLPLTT